MRIRKIFDHLIQCLKLCGKLAFGTIFMYWSIAAISKYISGPITSTVSYKFGDDGYGNISFPTVTICLDFWWVLLSPNGMFNNCSYLTKGGFHEALEFCTDDGTESTTTANYDCLTCFGGQLLDNEDNVEGIGVVNKFKDIQKLLSVAKMMDITDILSGFKFGYMSDTSQIINTAPGQILSLEERHELMRTHWKSTLHFKKGFCYTFEPKRLGQHFPVYDGEDLLKMNLYFNVSYNFMLSCTYLH